MPWYVPTAVTVPRAVARHYMYAVLITISMPGGIKREEELGFYENLDKTKKR